MEDLTGFGHFSHDLLQLLGDDYPRSPIMLYALRLPQPSVSLRPQCQPPFTKVLPDELGPYTHHLHWMMSRATKWAQWPSMQTSG